MTESLSKRLRPRLLTKELSFQTQMVSRDQILEVIFCERLSQFLVVGIMLVSQHISSIFDSLIRWDIVHQSSSSLPNVAARNDSSIYDAQFQLEVEKIMGEITTEFELDEVEGDLCWRRLYQVK